MVNLIEYENYFNSVKDKTGIKHIAYLTNESDMGKLFSDITPEQQPFMIVIIPSAKSNGSSQDDVSEDNYGLLYVLNKDERGELGTFTIQKELQPYIERVKKQMIEDKDSCAFMRDLDVSSFHTDPESKLVSRATGWSLSFNFKTDL